MTLGGGIYPSKHTQAAACPELGWLGKNIHTYIHIHLFWLPRRKCYQIFPQPLNKEELAMTVKFSIHRMLGG